MDFSLDVALMVGYNRWKQRLCYFCSINHSVQLSTAELKLNSDGVKSNKYPVAFQ